MTISTKLTTLINAKQQTDLVIEARAAMQTAREAIDRAALRLQEIAESGSFDTVDAEIKTALIAGKKVIDDCRTAFAAVSVKELLDWSNG